MICVVGLLFSEQRHIITLLKVLLLRSLFGSAVDERTSDSLDLSLYTAVLRKVPHTKVLKRAQPLSSKGGEMVSKGCLIEVKGISS